MVDPWGNTQSSRTDFWRKYWIIPMVKITDPSMEGQYTAEPVGLDFFATICAESRSTICMVVYTSLPYAEYGGSLVLTLRKLPQR